MFINEIVWCYSGGRGPENKCNTKHDIILWYGVNNLFNKIRVPYSKGIIISKTIEHRYHKDGAVINDWWMDIPGNGQKQRLKFNYPTQKPYKLLERIICLSTK